jgi:protein-tyrosine-phosphatase
MRTQPLLECCTPLAGSSLSNEEAVELERLLKTLADRHRLRIVNILLRAAGEAVCVCEFQPQLGLSQPTVSHHLRQLLDAGLVEREKRGSYAYYRLAHGALEQIGTLFAEAPVPNAGRSQMAAGLVRLRSGGRVQVRSAGSDPTESVNPAVFRAMDELGVDMSQEYPKPLSDEVVRAADVVITMRCGDACPIYPGKRYEDWELDDPAEQDLEAVRRIRDDIDARVQTLAGELLER